MTDHQVVVAGGGPTGLMLAAELALVGVDVVIVERRPTQDLDGSRAGGLHARTIEVLDQRGVADRFLAAGQTHPAVGYAQIPLDITDLPTRHNYVLALWQGHIERILADWVAELGVPIHRSREITGFVETASHVEVHIADHQSLRADYLVGCDGGRSVVRKAAGIDFEGIDASTSWMIAQVEMDDEPEFGFRRDGAGTHAINRRAEGEPIGVVITERSLPSSAGEPTIDDLREALVAVYGSDFGLRSASWISRFTDAARQATAYRRGRVLLAGDAAHVHPPHGGQGLNVGVQDAVNLGWKLARVVAGRSPQGLLDSYHAERHPVGARAIHATMAQVALSAPDDRHRALRETMTELLGLDEPRRRMGAMLAGLDVEYDLGAGHPLLGRRMPDLDLTTATGPTRLFTLLHDAQPLFLTFGGTIDRFDLGHRKDDVRVVEAAYDGTWVLPVVGEVEAPAALLVRPDGHVAWLGSASDSALQDAISRWF